jgi:SSS family solute:Na+ symporter
MTLWPHELSFWAILLSHIVLYTQWFCTDQMFVQRYCSPKDIREARWTLQLSMLTTVPVWAYFIIVGTTIWAFYRHFPDPVVAAAKPEEAFPIFISTQFPIGLSGLFATAVCLAAMPSSSINAAAATIETDFYRRFLVRGADERHYLVAGRIFTIIFGALVMGVAIVVHDVRQTTLIELQAVMLGIFGSGLLGLFLLGFATRTSNQAAAIATAATIALVLGWLALAHQTPVRSWWPHNLWLGVVANLFLFATGLCWDLWRRMAGVRVNGSE